LEIEISCSQWEGSACTHDGPWFFLGRGGAGRGMFFLFFFIVQSLPSAISLGQKWWPTVLEIKNTCNQMGWSMHSRCLDFLSFKFWVEGVEGGFFSFFLCSLYVPFKFPMCSPRVLQVAPFLNPICFAQSPPLLTYIWGPKGQTFHLSVESLYWRSLCSLNLLLQWANQIGALPKKKKKSWTCEAPPTN